MTVLRPGDLRGRNLDQQPERRLGAPENKAPNLNPLWIAAYDKLSAAEARCKCETDPVFNALAEELYARRNPQGVQLP
jgi:hypothetical protein